MTVAREAYQPLHRWDALSCLALTVLTVVLFLYFLRPPIVSDQLDYFYHAWQTDGLQPAHRHLRIGLIFPVHLAIKIFGYSELSYYAAPALGALSIVLGTWFVGRILFGTWTGLLAGVLMVSNPLVLASFTDLLPDYLSAGLYTVSLGILLWCWQTGRLATRPTGWTTLLLLVLSGFLIGWSYLVREYVVFFFPLVIFVLLVTSARSSSFVAVAVGAIVCWVLELIWGLIRHGDPLARFHAVVSPRAVSQFVEMDTIDILIQLPYLVLDRSGGLIFLVFCICGMAVTVWCALRGDRRWQVMALWLIGGWFFFTVVALLPVIWLGDEHVYLRMHKFRYWALILPPAAVTGVAASQQLIALFAKRAGGGVRPAGALAAGIVAVVVSLGATSGIVSASRDPGLVRNGTDDYDQFRRFIENAEKADELVLLQGGPLSVSAKRSLPIYLNTWNGSHKLWRGRVLNASTRDLDDIIRKPGTKLVAIDLSRAQRLRSAGRGRSPEEVLRRLEQAGQRDFESTSGRVVVYKLERKQEGG